MCRSLKSSNDYEINESLRDYGMIDFQTTLCQLMGFVYGYIYLVGYQKSKCECECHKGVLMFDCDCCYYDPSFPPEPFRLVGVYQNRLGRYLLFSNDRWDAKVYTDKRQNWIIR
jgi:hypothetical protein